jgi:predicted metal-dependent phosphoesterase TrpH
MMRTRGVRAFSITDHDSLQAYAALGEENLSGMELIVGLEINTTYQGGEVHILGYGLPTAHPRLGALLQENRQAREQRVLRMVEQLRGAGYDITPEDVRSQAIPGAALGRPHVAKALIKSGFARTVDDAFSAFLRCGRPGYVPSLHITPQRAVAEIVAVGGAAVLAHPGRLKKYDLIDELVEAGIVGLEVFYPRHEPGQVAFFREKAREYGLVMTAGADFHDPRYNLHGVGMEVDEEDIRPFMELVL